MSEKDKSKKNIGESKEIVEKNQETNPKKKNHKKEAAVAAVLAASLVVPTAGAVKLAEENKREEDKLQAEYQEVEGIQAADNRDIGDLGENKVLNKFKVDNAAESLSELAEEINKEDAVATISRPDEQTETSNDTVTAQFNQEKEIKNVSTTKNSIYGSSFSNEKCGDNAYATLYNGQLTITGSGGIYDEVFRSNSNIKVVTISNNITAIGKEAFYSCLHLREISISSTVTTIDDEAFGNCYELTSITIPSSVTSIGSEVFYYCNSLATISFASGSKLTSIGSRAFYSCSSLTSITIPSKVTSIGSSAFFDCTSLTSISVDASNTTYSSDNGVLYNKNKTTLIKCPQAKTGSYTVPSTVTSIDFSSCNLTSISFASGSRLTSIGSYAFQYCRKLTSITIPSSVTSIGNSAFYYCSSLTSITIPSSVTSIGSDAFLNSGLTSITIPSSVTSIGSDAFQGCSSLTSISVNSSNSYYSSDNGVLYNKNKTTLIKCPQAKTGSYTVPNTVTSIEGLAFHSCSISISFASGSKLTTIGNHAFYNCSFTNITIPSSVTTIGWLSFGHCDGLTSVTIPNSVTDLGMQAFGFCSNLTSIVIPNSVTSIGSSAFQSSNNVTIYCKSGSTAETYAQNNSISYVLCSLSLNKTSGTCYVGGSNLTATISGQNGNLSTTSSNTSIATASISGSTLTIIPKAAGSATITVKGDAFSDITATYSVTVKATSVSLGATSGTCYVGGSNLTTTISGTNYGTLSATSSSTSIATASISGTTLTITPKAAGSATITVKEANGNKTATYSVTVKATSVSLGATSGTAYVGGSNLTTTISGTNYGTLSATSSSTSIATASISGTTLTITPKAAGSATITVKEANGNKTATYSVTVKATSVSLGATSGTAYVGGSNLTTTISGTNYGTLSATSSSTSIATASISGTTLTITPKAAGSATITVKEANGNKTATYSVTVKATSVAVSPTSGYVKVGGTTTSTISGDNRGTLSVTSSDSTIATGSISGTTLTISGKKAGSTTLTVKEANGNKTATYSVTVTSIGLSATSGYVKVGGTTTATISGSNYGTVTASSSDSTVATGSVSGTTLTISGKKAGTATITVTGANGSPTATYSVTVTSVSVSPTSKTIDLSGTKTFDITATKSNAGTITWTTSNNNIASLSATTGDTVTVTGKINGTATITATGANGSPVATCSVTVQTTPTSVSLNKTSSTLDLSGTKTVELTATIAPSTANASNGLTWTTSDSTVASLSATSGGTVTVTGKKNGTATITVTTGNGKTATCNVTVQTTPTGVTLDKITQSLDLSGTKTVELTATIAPSTANASNSLTWSTSDSTIVSISSSTGNKITATGLKNGTATVTATTANGKTATCVITVQTSPTEVSLNKTSQTLDMSGTKEIDLTATIGPSTANINNILTWTTSDSTVASLSATSGGTVTVTGKKNGTAVITVTTTNGKTATCNITVQTTLQNILLDKYNMTLDLSDEDKQTITVTKVPPTSNVGDTITWSSSNNQVATVDQNGNVTAVANGTVTITATSANGKTAETRVRVQTTLQSISLDKTDITLDMTGTDRQTLRVTNNPLTSDVGIAISWRSSNEEVAIVDTNGEVIGLKNGTAVITATSSNGKEATCNVTVQTTLVSVSLNETDILLDKTTDPERQLIATKNPLTSNIGDSLTWSSSNTAVATVDQTGKVTSVANGTAVITVTSANNKSASCNVTVRTSVDTISLNKQETIIDLSENVEEKLKVTINPSTADTYTGLTWESSNTSVATVDQNGKVTGIKNGRTTITVTSENSKSASCEVLVRTSVTEVELDKFFEMIDLSNKNKNKQLEATILPSTADTYTGLTWTSSNEEIATVDQNGKVTGESNGTVVITVTSENGKQASCEMTIQTTLKGIGFENEKYTMDISTNSQLQLEVIKNPLTTNVADTFTWESSDEDVAIIDEDGRVTAISNGEATITATSLNNRKATCKVEVQTTPTQVILDQYDAIIELTNEDKTINLQATIGPETANVETGITWTSSNEQIATVDQNGKVTGIRNGTTQIIATSENGKEATCNVKVQTTVTELIIENKNESGEISTEIPVIDLSGEEKEIQLEIKAEPESAREHLNLTWTTSDPSIATVDENGKVTAISNGEVTITATTEDGAQATFELDVHTTLQDIEIDQDIAENGLTILAGTNGKQKIELIKVPSTADAKDSITWSSSNPNIVTIDENGEMTAVGNGEAIITAVTENGKQLSFAVVVKTAVESISLDQELIFNDITDEQKQFDLRVKYSPENANIATGITWESLNNEVAEVDQYGIVTIKSAGTAVIKATTANGKEAICEVKVGTIPKGLVIENQEEGQSEETPVIDLSSGENEIQLNVKIEPANADTGINLTWTTSDSNVATVDENGKVTIVGNGDVTITSTTENGKQATFNLHAQTTLQDIEIDEDIAENGLVLDTSTNGKQKIELTKVPATANAADKITWTTSDPNIATVDENGEITAVGNGDVIITAITENGKTISFITTIHTSVESISLNKEKADIDLDKEDKTINLTAVINPVTADIGTSLTWESSDEAVATINTTTGEAVTVTGLKTGIAIIKATSENRKEAICKVTVGRTPSALVIDNNDGNGQSGKTPVIDLSNGKNQVQLDVKMEPADANIGTNLTWTTSNPKVATVDKNGKVTVIGNGEVTITATAENGTQATFNLKGQTTLKDISVDKKIEQNGITLDTSTNGKQKINLIKEPATANTADKITWRSSDTSKAIVSSTGEITAVGNGDVTITATTENGKTVKFKVHVQTSVKEVKISDEVAEIDTTKVNTYQLKVNSYPSTANQNTKITYTSSNPKVATVDKNGKVTAKSNGTATITVTTENGKKDTIKITVKNMKEQTSSTGNNNTNKVSDKQDKQYKEAIKKQEMAKSLEKDNKKVSLDLDKKFVELNLKKKSKTKLKVEVDRKLVDVKTLTWTSTNTKVAAVDQNGEVTAISEGTSEIIVEALDGTQAKATVEVKDTKESKKTVENKEKKEEKAPKVTKDNTDEKENNTPKPANQPVQENISNETKELVQEKLPDEIQDNAKDNNETNKNSIVEKDNDSIILEESGEKPKQKEETLGVKEEAQVEETAMTERVVKGTGIVGTFAAITGAIVSFFKRRKK